MTSIAMTINLPTCSRNPQEYHNAIHEAVAAATARGDSMGAHALAGLLALMVPMGVHTQGEPVSLPFAQGGVVDAKWTEQNPFNSFIFESIDPMRCPRCYARSHNCDCADPTKPAQE